MVSRAKGACRNAPFKLHIISYIILSITCLKHQVSVDNTRDKYRIIVLVKCIIN